MRKLERGEVIMQELPKHVSEVFYRRSNIQLWTNDIGTAFGNSVPHTPEEVQRALEWLVLKYGGSITWERTSGF